MGRAKGTSLPLSAQIKWRGPAVAQSQIAGAVKFGPYWRGLMVEGF